MPPYFDLPLIQLCISCGRRSGIARPLPLRSVICGPCWFDAGGHTTAAELRGTPAALAAVLPRTAGEWLQALLASGWLRARRRDCARKFRALVETLACGADREDHNTWPTLGWLIEATWWARPADHQLRIPAAAGVEASLAAIEPDDAAPGCGDAEMADRGIAAAAVVAA